MSAATCFQIAPQVHYLSLYCVHSRWDCSKSFCCTHLIISSLCYVVFDVDVILLIWLFSPCCGFLWLTLSSPVCHLQMTTKKNRKWQHPRLRPRNAHAQQLKEQLAPLPLVSLGTIFTIIILKGGSSISVYQSCHTCFIGLWSCLMLTWDVWF